LGAVRDGSAAGVSLLVGTTAEEDRLFTVTGWNDESATVHSVLADLLADPADVAAAEALYADLPGTDRDRRYVINTDHDWAEPARAFAEAQSAAGNAVFHYEYARRSSALGGRVGAAHLSELPVFWGNVDAPGVASLLGEEATGAEVIRLAERTSAAVARFVATGSPDGDALGSWPAFTAADRQTKIIDLEPAVERDHLGERLDFWAQHASAPALGRVGAGAETAADSSPEAGAL
jgi:para-nitrobenzyl esterase